MWAKVVQLQKMIDVKINHPSYDQEAKLYYITYDNQIYVSKLEKGPYRFYRERII